MYTNTRKPIHNISGQQGAVLIVSLIILVVMTLIGVASMSTSLLQEKMAYNAQNTNTTFQAAESAFSILDTRMRNGVGDLDQTMGQLGSQGPVVTYDVANPEIDASFQLTYLGTISVSRFTNSLDADESSTKLNSHRFELAATGTMLSSTTQTVVRQGVEYH